MNTAARLESANKALKTTILVSKAVVDDCSFDTFRPMGRVVVRGRSTPITVFEPINPDQLHVSAQLRSILDDFDAGKSDAMMRITALSAQFPDDAAMQNLIQRMEQTGAGGSYGLD
jgi:adenylate cyclase